MLRNIPNKLRSSHMIELLDEHCKLVNEAAGKGVYAYNVLCLTMDFRESGWTVYGSKKVIGIVPAKIQGHAKLVRHLKQQKLECDDDDFLPAAFSPVRDGVTAGPGGHDHADGVRRRRSDGCHPRLATVL